MSASMPNDGSEDVNDFLQRIKELGDKRDQEDEERNRLLEEDILKGRAERQARRAERARSISPTKSSPASTPIAARTLATPEGALSKSPNMNSEAGSKARGIESAMHSLTGGSTLTMKENISPVENVPSASAVEDKRGSARISPSSAMPARNSPLPWQRRPTSEASDRPRSRPLSMVATENAARSPRTTAAPEPSANSEAPLSREQIAQSLASKDPAWFRQTADRGVNSPAYRRNQVEDEDRSDHGSSFARIQMPGMSQTASSAEKMMEDPTDRLSSPSRTSTLSGSDSRKSHGASPKVSTGFGSPMPLTSAQRFEPPSGPKSEGHTLAMSPTQGRISPERLDRPSSPTKGLGGFVQSAMMKRSDSVNKRWSVQSPAGLSRVNSVASRASVDLGSAANVAIPTAHEPRIATLSREGSPRPLSRPTSSHSNATLTQERPDTSSSMRSSMTASTTSTANDVFVKPALPASRTQTPTGARPSPQDSFEGTAKTVETTPPTSPSKTMDSRRWSPTKSSWLESALNKPESPKPKAIAPVPQQPAWMSEITKAKQKGSADLNRSPTSGPKHEVSIGGLMRSPPPGGLIKPQSLGSITSTFRTSTTSKMSSGSPQEVEALAGPKNSDPATTSSTVPFARSSPAAGKVKPDTPPKKDFRASLKPRQIPSDDNKSNEPEFKNALGQLRRTKTQNYVAPDELKSNITRGKAALNLTGGPKKTERKDEFKEAILKKKEDFKKAQVEGKGVTRSTSIGDQERPPPEAIAKRRALGRSDSNASDLSGQSSSSRPQSLVDSPKPSRVEEASAPGRLQGRESPVGKLAGRLNPSLAGLLARGPPAMASDTSRSSSPAHSMRSASVSTSTTDANEPSPQLTHMTKSRARGPRRKAPTSAPTSASSSAVPAQVENPSDFADETSPVKQEMSPRLADLIISKPQMGTSLQAKIADLSPASPTKANLEGMGSQPSSPRKLDMKRRSQFLQETSNELEAPKPLSPTKKANPSEVPMKSSPTTKPKPVTARKPSPISKVEDEQPNVVSASVQPFQLPSEPLLLAKPASVASPSNALASNNSHHAPAKVGEESPSKLPSAKETTAQWSQSENATIEIASSRVPTSPSKTRENNGLNSRIQGARPLPTPPMKGIQSSPKSPALGSTDFPTKSSSSLEPQSSEASRVIGDFFTGLKTKVPEFRVDTAALLSARPDQGSEIKTLRSSLYQMSSDGKKQVVPSHQERILFEGNLYLCTHTFGTPTGQRITQVYFWLGDEVPKSVIEDTEIFARREAKSAGGELITLRQGKETPEFFQALGGIIIIRRGTSNRYDSLAPHILCGRKHCGQIAFDEVDFSPDSLCSGFPYLLSTKSGKSYLWKGKGSGIEELSCARLIGMDFGLTGEIEEVEDGNEPPSFFLDTFGKDAQIVSAAHWKLKSNYNKYSVRLFLADSTIREQIAELSPFSWADLETDKIYILDAFFEIYIIVGSEAQSQYPAFQNALVFAQEYGIIAASMEDRPYIPVTTVVLEGVPKDMKSVFRKWIAEAAPTLHKGPPAGSLQRWRSLRVLPLNAALEATRR